VDGIRREIFFFETRDGRTPARDWLDRIEGQPAYSRIMARLDRVEHVNFGEHRSVGGGVSELVIDFGPGYRIYYGQDGAEIVILLVAGNKATQQKDVETAKEYWRTYND
jgi:putative addiction module killer protein